MWFLQFVAIPIGIFLVFLTGFLVALLNLVDTIVIHLYHLLALVAIIPVHEFLHAVMFPARLASDHVMFGFWPKAFVFYAHYDGVLTRRRFIGVFLAPLLVISVLPLVLLKLFAIHHQSLVLTCALVNAFCSAGDVLGVALILFQLPRKTMLRNQGFRTYWKVPAAGREVSTQIEGWGGTSRGDAYWALAGNHFAILQFQAGDGYSILVVSHVSMTHCPLR
ncbi:DUF3267 domain-containing protein [Alicyclobacillus macrosporangiidus]|nr:DUF3267 domain-containing protein [Alicyclobacillus macrosporangiidus]